MTCSRSEISCKIELDSIQGTIRFLTIFFKNFREIAERDSPAKFQWDEKDDNYLCQDDVEGVKRTGDPRDGIAGLFIYDPGAGHPEVLAQLLELEKVSGVSSVSKNRLILVDFSASGGDGRTSFSMMTTVDAIAGEMRWTSREGGPAKVVRPRGYRL
jgi:hypothetical protein